MTSNDLHDLSDDKLLFLIKKGNELAFKVIYNKYWKRLFTYTYNILNDRGLAEDVLHEIFTNIWFKRDEIKIESLEKYLFVAAKNKSISMLRKVKFSKLDEIMIENLTLEPEVENHIDSLYLKNLLEKVTIDLPKRCKEIFYMSRYDDYSNEEIAEYFKISQRTVENQLYLALKHIRTSIKRAMNFIIFFIFMS
ncbi:sigma-70 family RNA polymerase sigma factor [Wenyingzhuangia sp. 1_MG-2023]|nr:sigma-70 family RNA polymerase sigma factor [Wenyingzhuangia sp. 1_MG-2023]